jgi:hypothetical protein
MGLETKTYWLTDRQSQCDFDFGLKTVNSEGSNQFNVDRRSRRTEDSTVKFMCCKIVKRLTVIVPSEYSNKPSVKYRTRKLFVALPGNTRQYFENSYMF